MRSIESCTCSFTNSDDYIIECTPPGCFNNYLQISESSDNTSPLQKSKINCYNECKGNTQFMLCMFFCLLS